DLEQARLHVLGAVDQGLEGGLDELAQLLDRGLAEDRRRVADEVLPELAGRLLDLGLGPQPHQRLVEAALRQRALARLLDHEHDAVSPRLQLLTDADTVVGRAVRAFGKEDDRLATHEAFLPGVVTCCGGGRRRAPAPAKPWIRPRRWTRSPPRSG